MVLEPMQLNVAERFSAYPAGRDDNDGPFNGERFRRDILTPLLREAIRSKRKLIVSFRGVKSYGSSFLEEAFGGLVRDGFQGKELMKVFEFDFGSRGNSRYLDALNRYISEASKRT